MIRPCSHNTASDRAPSARSPWLAPLALWLASVLALWALAPGSAQSSSDSAWLSSASVQQGNVADTESGESFEDLPAVGQRRVALTVVSGHDVQSLTLDPYLPSLWHEQTPRAPPRFV